MASYAGGRDAAGCRKATLRLFGKADDVLAKLVGRLSIPAWRPPRSMPEWRRKTTDTPTDD